MIQRHSIVQALASYGASAVLILVAVNQVAHAFTGTLTPWKGGGFGMFSSTDSLQTRSLRCYLTFEVEGREHETLVAMPSFSGDTPAVLERLKAAPSEKDMQTVAREILAATWVLETKEIGRWQQLGGDQPWKLYDVRPARLGHTPEPGQKILVKRVRLEFHRVRFRAEGTLNSERVFSHTVSAT